MPNSKDKGSRFERWVANRLRDLFPDVATARYMNQSADDRGIDLVNTKEFAFQTKHYAKRTPNDWDVLDHMQTEDTKIYVKKIDRREPLVVMSFEDFKALIVTR